MKLKLFLTFDHELPLGKIKSSYSDSLFNPTQKVLDLADKLGVKVTLFSDILCAKRFKKWDELNFYNPYVSQLQYATKNGHDVQLHIHPHWLTSDFQNGVFIPSNDFALSDFEFKTQFGGIEGVVKQAIDDLTNICKQTNPNYKCIAFRAGGYNISNSTKKIINALSTNGILFDSSMARGYYFKSGISEVDFRKLPNASNWFVNASDIHNSVGYDGILEIPIATIPKSVFEIPVRFKLKKFAYRAPISHGELIHVDGHVDKISKLKMMFASRMLTFDNYTLSLDYLMHIFEYNINKYKSVDTLMMSVISHPKSMGDYSLSLMEEFVIAVQKRYPTAEFLTFATLNQTSKR